MPETRQVPKSALAFEAKLGKNQFADGDRTRDTSGAMIVPVTQLGRSAEPINHWYWGQVVHDMAGFTTDQERLPIDWRHDDRKIGIGYLDQFKADNSGLNVSGALVSIKPDDQADEIIRSGDAGVPYQASIFFDDKRIEEVMPGATADVNGYQIQGPAIIVREWSLKGMAVCLYGADHRTNTKFSEDGGETVAVEIHQLEPQKMADATNDTNDQTENEVTPDATNELNDSPTQETEAPAATPVETELSADDPRAELKRFVKAFGAENGAKWYGDGLEFSDALSQHVNELGNQLSAKDEQIAKLENRLKSIDRGENDPVEFGSDQTPDGTPAKRNGFASRIKIAGASA